MKKKYVYLCFLLILALITIISLYGYNDIIVKENKKLCTSPSNFVNVLKCYEMGYYDGNEPFVLKQTLIYAEQGDEKAKGFVVVFLMNKKMNTNNLPLSIAEKYNK